MGKAIVVSRTGGPEVLEYRDIVIGKPGKGEVQIGARAIGVNFIDIYHRTGLYPQPLPFTPGGELCGAIVAVGKGVTDFKVGERVGCATASRGCYAECVNVIGTVSSPAKAQLAKANGCHHTIDYTRKDFVREVQRITKGQMLPVVYDSIGAATFPASLDCLRRCGLFVTYGNASGPVPPFSPALLAQKGSLFMTRPTLFDFVSTPEALRKVAGELFRVVKSGKVRISVNQRYPLAEAARAHEDLAARKTTGSIVLIP
jgi:NADPH:quinone reductase-like Zn-dependent oxidoreductase